MLYVAVYICMCLCFPTPNTDHTNFLFTFGKQSEPKEVLNQSFN